jgi:hypothetical protein
VRAALCRRGDRGAIDGNFGTSLPGVPDQKRPDIRHRGRSGQVAAGSTPSGLAHGLLPSPGVSPPATHVRRLRRPAGPARRSPGAAIRFCPDRRHRDRSRQVQPRQGLRGISSGPLATGFSIFDCRLSISARRRLPPTVDCWLSTALPTRHCSLLTVHCPSTPSASRGTGTWNLTPDT